MYKKEEENNTNFMEWLHEKVLQWIYKNRFTMKHFIFMASTIALMFCICTPSFSQSAKYKKELAKLEHKYNDILLNLHASDKSEKDYLKANKSMLKLAENGYNPAMRFLGTYFIIKKISNNMKIGMSKQRKTVTL